MLKDKHMELVKVHIDDNPVDLLTKGLASEWFGTYGHVLNRCILTSLYILVYFTPHT